MSDSKKTIDNYLNSVKETIENLDRAQLEKAVEAFMRAYRDGKTIYVDRHLPEKLEYHHDGKQRDYDPRRFLIDHESMEKALIDAFGWRYAHAHEAATAYERRHVLQSGLLWQPYQDAYRPYIKADEHEKLKKVPAELDLTPYEDSPKLLHHLQKVMR